MKKLIKSLLLPSMVIVLLCVSVNVNAQATSFSISVEGFNYTNQTDVIEISYEYVGYISGFVTRVDIGTYTLNSYPNWENVTYPILHPLKYYTVPLRLGLQGTFFLKFLSTATGKAYYVNMPMQEGNYVSLSKKSTGLELRTYMR